MNYYRKKLIMLFLKVFFNKIKIFRNNKLKITQNKMLIIYNYKQRRYNSKFLYKMK